MRFELHHEAADGDDHALRDLDDILRRVEEDVHELVFAEPDRIEESRWFNSCRDAQRRLTQKLAQAQLWSSKPARVSVRGPHQARAARDAAMTPLTILVENDGSDGDFVKALMLAYADAETRRVWEAGAQANPRGWKLEHGGGGGEIPRKIRAHPSGIAGPRLVVVCDSDRKHRSDPRNQAIDAYESEAQAIGARPPIVLDVRAIENYLPDAFWDAWLSADRNRAAYRAPIEALKSLSPEQRDFIKMEGDERLRADAPGPLFDGSDPQNPAPPAQHVAALTGPKRNLKQEPKRGDTRPMIVSFLPELVVNGQVSATHLDERDAPGRLRALVTIIAEEL